MKGFLLGFVSAVAFAALIIWVLCSCVIWAPYTAKNSKNFEGQIVIVIGYDQGKDNWGGTMIASTDTIEAIKKGNWSDELIVRCSTPEEAKRQKDAVLKALGWDHSESDPKPEAEVSK